MKGGQKSLIDMALSTATCACFAIPYVGGAAAGGVAIGQFLFDWYDPADAVNPKLLPADTQDILDAVDAIKSFLWDAEYNDKHSDIKAASDTFNLLWDEATATQAGVSTSAWNQFVARRTADCNQYFDIVKGPGEKLDNIRTWVEGKGDNNAAAGLYALNGSLLCAYHKNGLDWQNRVDLDDYADKKAKFEDYNDAYKLWSKNKTGPPPVTVDDPGPKLTSKDLTPLNAHAIALHDTLLPALIKFATKTRLRWRNSWDARDAQLAADRTKLVAQNPGLDAQAIDLQWGQILAFEWPKLGRTLNIEDVEEDDIDTLQKVIDKWQQVHDELKKFFP